MVLVKKLDVERAQVSVQARILDGHQMGRRA